MMVAPIGVTLLAAATPRAVAYAGAIRNASVPVLRAVILAPRPGSSGVDDLMRIRRLLSGRTDSIEVVDGADLNDETVIRTMGATGDELVIVAPPPGNILRASLLNSGGWFLHVHPGRLPTLRGSTTLHYAALLGDDAEITALLLDDGIDTGSIIRTLRVPLPVDRRRIEGDFDVEARATVLTQVLTELRERGFITARPQPTGPPALHTVHPVLRALALGFSPSGPSTGHESRA